MLAPDRCCCIASPTSSLVDVSPTSSLLVDCPTSLLGMDCPHHRSVALSSPCSVQLHDYPLSGWSWSVRPSLRLGLVSCRSQQCRVSRRFYRVGSSGASLLTGLPRAQPVGPRCRSRARAPPPPHRPRDRQGSIAVFLLASRPMGRQSLSLRCLGCRSSPVADRSLLWSVGRRWY